MVHKREKNVKHGTVDMDTTDPNEKLLNIKEAAAYLKVSEASLRRWTNAGKLHCMRLGLKKERRFRTEDLNAFLNGQGLAVSDPSPAPIQNAHVHLEGVAVEYGKHICTLYETDFGRLKWSVPFLLDGLKAGDCCFLVATDKTHQEILSTLKKSYEDVDDALEKGQLVLSNGIPSGPEMCRFVEKSIFEATQKGWRTFRLLGDMSWWLAHGAPLDALFEYEEKYNREIGHSYPMVSVCQYDTRDFPGTAVLRALKCHEDTFELPLSRFLAS